MFIERGFGRGQKMTGEERGESAKACGPFWEYYQNMIQKVHIGLASLETEWVGLVVVLHDLNGSSCIMA